MEQLIKEIRQKLESATKIVISAHRKPDPDAICSTIAFQNWIELTFPQKNSKIYFEDDFGLESFEYIPDINKINQTSDITKIVDKNTTFVLLDSPGIYRTTEHEDTFNSKETIIIDHHPLYETPNTLKYTNINMSSTCQIISKHFYTDAQLKKAQNGEILIQGMLSDAGGISYVGARNSEVLLEIKRIVDICEIDQIENLSIKATEIHPKQLEVYKLLMKNVQTASFSNLPSATYSYLTIEEVEKLDKNFLSRGRGQFHSSISRRVKNQPWGFVVTPYLDENKFGIGFRARYNTVDVQKIAQLFEGGGHKAAAGGNYTITDSDKGLDTPQIIVKILEIIENATKE